MKLERVYKDLEWQLTLTTEEVQLIVKGLERQIPFDNGPQLKQAQKLAKDICYSPAWSGVGQDPAPPGVLVIDCNVKPTPEQQKEIMKFVDKVLGKHVGVTRTIPTDIVGTVLAGKKVEKTWTCQNCGEEVNVQDEHECPPPKKPNPIRPINVRKKK